MSTPPGASRPAMQDLREIGCELPAGRGGTVCGQCACNDDVNVDSEFRVGMTML